MPRGGPQAPGSSLPAPQSLAGGGTTSDSPQWVLAKTPVSLGSRCRKALLVGVGGQGCCLVGGVGAGWHVGDLGTARAGCPHGRGVPVAVPGVSPCPECPPMPTLSRCRCPRGSAHGVPVTRVSPCPAHPWRLPTPGCPHIHPSTSGRAGWPRDGCWPHTSSGRAGRTGCYQHPPAPAMAPRPPAGTRLIASGESGHPMPWGGHRAAGLAMRPWQSQLCRGGHGCPVVEPGVSR